MSKHCKLYLVFWLLAAVFLTVNCEIPAALAMLGMLFLFVREHAVALLGSLADIRIQAGEAQREQIARAKP